jgi:plasmid replication initiation protein
MIYGQKTMLLWTKNDVNVWTKNDVSVDIKISCLYNKFMEQNQFKIENKSVQSNDLIRSVWSLDSVGLKIFEMAVSCIDTVTSSKVDNVVYLSKKAIFNMFSATDENRYTRFQQHLKNLQKQVVTVRNFETDKITQIVPIPTISYGVKDDDDLIKFEFNNHIMPYLVELKRNYTSYQIENIRNMTSRYSILMYKFIKMNAFKGNSVIVSVDEYRRYTDTQKRYKIFSDWEKRVITDAMNDLNGARTDIVMTYEKIKSGRKINAIRLKWRDRTSYNDINFENDDQMTIDDF